MCGNFLFGSVLRSGFEETTHSWAVVAKLYVVNIIFECGIWVAISFSIERWTSYLAHISCVFCSLRELLAFWMAEKPFLVYLFASVAAYLVQVHRMKWCCSRSGKWVQSCSCVCVWVAFAQSWLMYAIWCMSRQFSQSKPKIVFKFALT